MQNVNDHTLEMAKLIFKEIKCVQCTCFVRVYFIQSPITESNRMAKMLTVSTGALKHTLSQKIRALNSIRLKRLCILAC